MSEHILTKQQLQAIHDRWQANDQSYAHGDITTLLAEVERLTAALREIDDQGCGFAGDFNCMAVARQALEPEPKT